MMIYRPSLFLVKIVGFKFVSTKILRFESSFFKKCFVNGHLNFFLQFAGRKIPTVNISLNFGNIVGRDLRIFVFCFYG